MRFSALLPLVGLIALACNGGGDGNNDDDDTDTGPTYDPGCILVDGGGGYANIADALEVASDGSTIELCDVVEAEIVVSKAVTIVGNDFVVEPPINTSAFRIVEGGDLTVSDVRISTTRSAFVVEEGGTLTVTGATLEEVPNYGVDVQSGGTATLDDVTMVYPAWGGARVDGGTLILRNSDLQLRNIDAPDQSAPYGVLAQNDATVTLEGNSISGALLSLSDGAVFDLDGVGVWVQSGSTATLSGNTMIGNDIAAVSADGAARVEIDGDTYQGGVAAVAARGTALAVSNTEATDYFQWGALCVQCSEASFDTVVFETSPADSAPNTADRDGSSGIYALETEVVVTGTAEAPSRFVGNNRAGVLVSPVNGGSVSALTISDAIIDNNASFGIAIYSGELTTERVEVVNTRNDDAKCITDSGYSCNMAVALWSSNGTLTDTTIGYSGDWGLTLVNGVVDVIGGSVIANEQYGAFAQAGTMTFDGTEFAEGGQYQVALLQGASGVIENATFRDGSYDRVSEYESGEQTIRQVSYYSAQDILVSNADLGLADSTFQNGQRGISASGFDGGASVTITDTTFTGYNENVLNGSTGSSWDVQRVTLSDIGRQAVYCYAGGFSLDQVRIENVTAYKYKWEYFVDGEYQFGSDFERAERAMYANLCDLSMEDVTFEGLDGYAMWLSNTALEFDGVSVSDTFRAGEDYEYNSTAPAVHMQWTRSTSDGAVRAESFPTAFINDLSILGVPEAGGNPRDALRLESWVGNDAAADDYGQIVEGTLTFSNVTLGDTSNEGRVSGSGLDARRLADLELSGFDVGFTGQNAMDLIEVGGTLTGAVGERTGTLSRPGANGIFVDGTRSAGGTEPVSLTLTDITIDDPGTSGLVLEGGADHTVSNVTVTGAGEYGATCTDTTFATCDASLEGDLGAQLGCDACVADGT